MDLALPAGLHSTAQKTAEVPEGGKKRTADGEPKRGVAATNTPNNVSADANGACQGVSAVTTSSYSGAPLPGTVGAQIALEKGQTNVPGQIQGSAPASGPSQLPPRAPIAGTSQHTSQPVSSLCSFSASLIDVQPTCIPPD